MLYPEDIDRFKNLVVDNEFEALFEALFKVVRQFSPLLENNLLVMHGDYRRMTNDYQTQTISRDEYDLEANKLSRALLYFIDQLPVAKAQHTHGLKKKRYPSGKVLYDIPRKLPLQKVTKCVVRIGETEEIVLDNFQASPDAKIEDVRIAEVMEVELLDASEGKNFTITTLNSKDQKIYSDDYSEWFFFVTPLLAGQHDLYLKVSVLQIVEGKERAKEIVFERAVEVVSEEVELSPRNWEDTQVRIAGRQTDETPLEGFPDTEINLEDYLNNKDIDFSTDEVPHTSGHKPSDWDDYIKEGSLEDETRQYADEEPPPIPPPKPSPSPSPASVPKPPPRPSTSPSKGGLSTQPFPNPSPSSPQKKDAGASSTFGSPARRSGGFRWARMANLLVIAVATFMLAYYVANYTQSSDTIETEGKGDNPGAIIDTLESPLKQDSMRLELEE